MKETLRNTGTLLGAILLIVLALALVAFITPFAFCWKVYASIAHESRKARDIMEGTADFFIAIASSIDKFGNCAFGGFLSAVLLKEQEYRFGQNHETVSEVLGWGEIYNDLTRGGELLLAALNALDKDHARNAMLIGVIRAKQKVKLFNQLNPRR